MKDKTLSCSKCGSTEDADVIEAIGLCASCANREATARLIKDLRVSYGSATSEDHPE